MVVVKGKIARMTAEELEGALKDVWKPEMEKCDLIDEFDERIECKSEILHGISVAQDLVNLNVHGDFFRSDPQCSLDSRWEAVNMLDNANAVFLGVSKYSYDPKFFLQEGDYVENKADKFCSRYRRLLWNREEPPERQLKKRTEKEKAESIKAMGPEWKKWRR